MKVCGVNAECIFDANNIGLEAAENFLAGLRGFEDYGKGIMY